MGDDLGSDPDLAATGAAMREEWRAEEEMFTGAAATRWSHSRTLADLATECLHRGDTVTVVTGGATFTGSLVDVRADLLALRTASGRVDVNLAAPTVLRVASHASEGGARAGVGASSFRARLEELEAAAADVTIGTALLDDALRGRLVLGRDQLGLEHEGATTYVSLGAVAWIAAAATEL